MALLVGGESCGRWYLLAPQITEGPSLEAVLGPSPLSTSASQPPWGERISPTGCFPPQFMVPMGQSNSVLEKELQLLQPPMAQRLKATDSVHRLSCGLSALQPTMNRNRNPTVGSTLLSGLPGEGQEQWTHHLAMLLVSWLGHFLRRLRRRHYPYSASFSATEKCPDHHTPAMDCL